jgi:hypothetical protein
VYWNSFSTDQVGLGLTTELATFAGGNGDTIHAWVARPTTDGPHPGIVVLRCRSAERSPCRLGRRCQRPSHAPRLA